MPLAGRAHTQDEATHPRFQTGLIWVPDDRRIKERCRLHRILLSEVRAYQQLPIICQCAEALCQVAPDTPVTAEKVRAKLMVPRVEVLFYIVDKSLDL